MAFNINSIIIYREKVYIRSHSNWSHSNEKKKKNTPHIVYTTTNDDEHIARVKHHNGKQMFQHD